MEALIKWVTDNKEFVAIIGKTIAVAGGLLGVLIPYIQFVYTKRFEQYQINLSLFHEKMMGKVTNVDLKAGLDEQIAVIYELRHFPKYYPVVKRILERDMPKWEAEKVKRPELQGLIDEAKCTIKFIELHWFSRLIMKYRDKE